MYTVLVVVASMIAVVSWLFVSQATSGVAGICFACFVAITARLAQADRHQKKMLQAIAHSLPTPLPIVNPSMMTVEQKAAVAGMSTR